MQNPETFSIGEEIILVSWGAALVRGINRGDDGLSITELDLELNVGGDVKKTKNTTRLAAVEGNFILVDLLSYGTFITKDKFLAPVTEFRTEAFADCNVAAPQHGAIIQFEREGYFRLDAPSGGEGPKMVFIEIPSRKA